MGFVTSYVNLTFELNGRDYSCQHDDSRLSYFSFFCVKIFFFNLKGIIENLLIWLCVCYLFIGEMQNFFMKLGICMYVDTNFF